VVLTRAAPHEVGGACGSYEKNLRALRASGRPVSMLSAFTMSLLATFLLGADGCISGTGSVTADLQAELFAAVKAGNLEKAHRVNERLAPLVNVFYAPPSPTCTTA
jgi:4-hydroxy-tetrahydrodipicolinate synthase